MPCYLACGLYMQQRQHIYAEETDLGEKEKQEIVSRQIRIYHAQSGFLTYTYLIIHISV